MAVIAVFGCVFFGALFFQIWQLAKASPEQRKLLMRSRIAYYVAGLPDVRPGKVRVAPTAVQHVIRVRGRELRVARCEWLEKGQRSARGAVLGGAVGDLAFGVPGAVAGALVGGRRRNNSLTALTCDIDGLETVVYFRTTAREHQQLMSVL